MRILVAEDEFLVGLVLEEDLRAAGHAVSGPHATLASAAEASRREPVDLAVLDINLADQMVYPLADELLERGIPFVFLSGYSAKDMPERFRKIPRLAKPYDPEALLLELQRIMT
jgi:DNA-binding response OmpR family regulator